MSISGFTGVSKDINPSCAHKFANEQFELCLPSNEWKTEKAGNTIWFKNNTDNSLGLNKALLSVTIKKHRQDLSAEQHRDDYFDQLSTSDDIDAKLVSKGTEVLNGRTFYDFEMTAANGRVYDYLMFYKKDRTEYILRAAILEKDRDGVGKNVFLNFFKSFQIK